ncbi:hypothetical protein Chor_013796 [Crotalus horridus]
MPSESSSSSSSSSSSDPSAESPMAELGEAGAEDATPVITPAMQQEEERLEAEGREKERQRMEKAYMNRDRDSNEMRYKRLQHLLEKSNIYSKFLLTKMEQQQLEEQQKKEKLERKGTLNTAKNEKLNDQKDQKIVKKKRVREDRTYNISDLESNPPKLCAEEIQTNGDSNSIIKDRLAQVMRHSAKHFVDPKRKFKGQPVPFQQPKLFTGGVMRWYQVEGMEWLRV